MKRLLSGIAALLLLFGTTLAEAEYADTPGLAGPDLPPVSQRLPVDPLIVKENAPDDGPFGGTLMRSAADPRQDAGHYLCEGLFILGPDGKAAPNVARGYDVNADATVYTIRLREGMRWSDGQPFTAEDCVWFYNTVCLNRLDTKGVRKAYRSADGTPAAVELVNSTTYSVTFSSPRPGFIEELAADPRGHYGPRHALGEVVQAVLDGDNAGALALCEARFGVSFADVVKMGKETLYYAWSCPGLPTLNAFVLDPAEGQKAMNNEGCTYLRNPWYWKVDPLGRQLPYADRLQYTRDMRPVAAP